MENLDFLKKQHPEMAKSEPVLRSVRKKQRMFPEDKTEELSDEDKIGIHLDRIEKILEHKSKGGDVAGGNPAGEGRRKMFSASDWLKQSIVESSVVRVNKKDGTPNTRLLKEISRNL